ncbi:protein turtle [Trichonephila clavipes]|uniref:Protein turtle n=1 Tax=Trichonephila clavipes TaxID=2585209 RepID=A0A8X6RH52_TRICX|nr:protein turtle [Trichonephila clavipes]
MPYPKEDFFLLTSSPAENLMISGPAVITVPPRNTSKLEGGKVEFICEAKALPANITHRWYHNSIDISQLSWLESRSLIRKDGLLFINPLTAEDSGLYTCEVSNGIGNPDSSSAYLSVEYPARVTYSPTIQYLPSGLSGILRCYVQANPPFQFINWTKDRRPFDPNANPGVITLNNGSLLFQRVSHEHQGRYRCTPYNVHGTAGTSNIMEVLVREIKFGWQSTAPEKKNVDERNSLRKKKLKRLIAVENLLPQKTAKKPYLWQSTIYHQVKKIGYKKVNKSVCLQMSVKTMEKRRKRSWSLYLRLSKGPQRKYSAYDRELHKQSSIFKYILKGCSFIIFTDHKQRTFAFEQNLEKVNPLEFHSLDFIGQYTTNIQFIFVADNKVADTLSRICTVNFPSSLNYESLSMIQEVADLILLKENSNIKILKLKLLNSSKEIYCNASAEKIRTCIPLDFRKIAFDACHQLSHPSIRATTKLVVAKYIGPNIKKDCQQWTRACIACQQSKIHRHTCSALERISVLNKRFNHLDVDIAGPLPTCQRHRNFFTVIDKFTCCIEAIPLQDRTAEIVAKALISIWISRFEILAKIMTDQRRQFESRSNLGKIFWI